MPQQSPLPTASEYSRMPTVSQFKRASNKLRSCIRRALRCIVNRLPVWYTDFIQYWKDDDGGIG